MCPVGLLYTLRGVLKGEMFFSNSHHNGSILIISKFPSSCPKLLPFIPNFASHLNCNTRLLLCHVCQLRAATWVSLRNSTRRMVAPAPGKRNRIRSLGVKFGTLEHLLFHCKAREDISNQMGGRTEGTQVEIPELVGSFTGS